MIEETVKTFLTDILMNVPLVRGQLSRGELQPREYLDVLKTSVLFFPVFRNWSSPVTQWLPELKQLSEELDDAEAKTFTNIRQGVVLMRLNELDEALKKLDELSSDISPRFQCWKTLTQSRIYTRKQDFERAWQELTQGESIALESQDWLAVLPLIAKGELQLEKNDISAARETFFKALNQLSFEWIEERVQVLQSLGFIYITLADIEKAFPYLDEARQVLKGASIWTEVIQMNLVVGNFLLSQGETQQAEILFNEGLQLCQSHSQPQFEATLQMGLSRLKVSDRKFDEAIQSSLKSASLLAQQGNTLGYVSMIIYLSKIYIQAQNFPESYRTLVTGVSISKHLKIPLAEKILRIKIETLKNEILGSEKF
ncbi:MAG: hypothetical protein AAGA60_27830, partial [Cyanobacteria bacterium P01_E01_bin.42]